MKKIFILALASLSLHSCHIYEKYERPDNLPTKGLYRNVNEANADTVNFGNKAWREVFTDPLLQDLIQKALQQNTNMQEADLTILQAEQGYKISRLAFLPQLALSPQGTLTSWDFGKATQVYNIPVSASWQIDAFGSLRNAKKQSEMSLMQARIAKQAVQTSIIANVANLYYTLVMLDEQLNTTKSTITLWEDNVRTMEAMAEAAMTNFAAVAQAKANLMEIKASVPALEQNIQQTENALSVLLHEAPHSIARAASLSSESFPASMSVGVPLQLLANRPDVRIAEYKLAYAFYGVQKAHSAFYPQITISGQAGWTNNSGMGLVNPGKILSSAVGSIVQPLFMKGQLTANLKISKAQQEMATLDFEQALLNAGQEVSNALTSYQTAISKAEIRTQEVEKLQEAKERTLDLFKYTNTTSYLETLTAQQSLLNAQLSLINDNYSKVQAIINLYAALGGGRE